MTPGGPSPQGDLKFLDMMTAHHERAVVLWRDAATRASHPELRDFAVKAIEEQHREMFLMKLWRDRWFAGAPVSTGPKESIAAEGGMTIADRVSGPAFDEAFLAMMITHHKRAAEMARSAASDAELPEIRKLAQIIVDQQDEEVKTMQSWQKAWFGTQQRPEIGKH
ncbi:MAG TPA: DUF305 domain-containing protein [Thermoanaerobaculia bacterium]|nr:DUF305 domain-containing protein [Thermoanaerobaculia bacterium]